MYRADTRPFRAIAPSGLRRQARYLIGTDSATVAGSSSRSSNASDGPQQRSSTSRGSIGAMEVSCRYHNLVPPPFLVL